MEGYLRRMGASGRADRAFRHRNICRGGLSADGLCCSISDGLKIPGSFEAMRTEGGISVRNKKRAEAEEQKRRRKLVELTVNKDGRLDTGVSLAPVLNVAPFPPFPGFTGSQIAMADRLGAEKGLRTVALAYPRDGAWWLEVWSPALTGYFSLGTKSNVLEIIAQAARLMRTKLVHVESNAGLPLNLVEGLEHGGLRTMLSIHDFVFFCRRLHLVEQPYGEFCDYCTDALRCAIPLAGPGRAMHRFVFTNGISLRAASVRPESFTGQRA